MLKEKTLAAHLADCSPKEGTRAAESRKVAQLVDTSWKAITCESTDFRKRLLACTSEEELAALAEEAFDTLLVAIDAAVKCGEPYLSCRIPTDSYVARVHKSANSAYESFFKLFEERFNREGYMIVRLDETYSSSLFGGDSVEVVYICW